MNQLVNIVKADGTKQLFEEEKLVNSLERVGASPEAIDSVVEAVGQEIHNDMTTAEIYDRAFELLKKQSHHVAVKYSIRRAIMELGPDGFPFEKFVARIFKMWGYEALTDQIVMGTCVEHEIDVVAWKNTDLAMAEAKYHNEFNMKSDLKVVLYVKERFDDLSLKEFQFGGQKMKLTGKYLFTNTKFTDKAIAYSQCGDLKLIGWNYPSSNNLHEIIEKNGLHPISCITQLSHQEKRELIGQNVLVCIDLLSNPSVLDAIGVKDQKRQQIIDEVKEIIGRE